MSRSLKYDSNFFFDHRHIYIYIYIYIWTPRPITLPRSRCACGVKIEACHIQAHEGCRIHACIIQHTYCICAHLHMLVCAAHTLHPYCMHVAYTKIGSAPHVYHPLQKWITAVCVLHIYCVQRNTHAECTCAKCAQITHMYTKNVLLAFVLYVCIL